MTAVSTGIWLCFLLTILGVVTGAAADDSSNVTVAWPAGPAQDADGLPVPRPVRYQVFASRDGGPAAFLAEVVDDTTCVVTLRRAVTYRIRVVAMDADGRPSVPSAWSKAFVARSREASPPGLLGNSPNPFNPLTRISYAVPSDLAPGTPVRLEIFDVRGRMIRRLPVELTPGEHTVEWNGADERGAPLPTGTYIAQFVHGDLVATLKMLLAR